MKVGVVGATGLVGEVFLRIIGERKFPITEMRPFASENSAGLQVLCSGQRWPVQKLSPGCFRGLDLVFFSSGDEISKEWAPRAVADGAFAIDNSAAFRMNADYPLVVPEVNRHVLPAKNRPTIIANPNCSTIQLVVALQPLKAFGLERLHVASYQSVSGAGKAGPEELIQQTHEQLNHGHLKSPPQTFSHEIAFNCVPHIGSFNADGFTSEEVKIMSETRKIMELPNLKVSAFTVRVPSLNAHSEAVWVTLKKEVDETTFLKALSEGEGLRIYPEKQSTNFPTARLASGTNPVHVGRIHRDPAEPKTWLMWIVADNILKGAALNGIQIAEELFTPV